MPEESEIHGTIKDHNSKGVEGVFVEAYHCPFWRINPPIVGEIESLPPHCFLGKSEKTDERGEFSIIFRNNAYGFNFSFFNPPNIELWIVDEYRKLYTNRLRILVNSANNDFTVKIPEPAVRYSDEIDHVDWPELIANFIDGVNKPDGHPEHLTPEELKEKITALLIPIYKMKYTKLSEQIKVPPNYRGDIISYMTSIKVGKQVNVISPKKYNREHPNNHHSDEIPSDWRE